LECKSGNLHVNILIIIKTKLMAVYLGDETVATLYLGDEAVANIYLGTETVL